MDTNTNNTLQDAPTVAQLAIAHPGALAVFTKYNIDFCCGGHRSLEEACGRIRLDAAKVRSEIYQSRPVDSLPSLRPERWSSAFLADFIVQNHHTFVKNTIPELEALLDKVCDRHGNDCLELLSLREYFLDLAEDLTEHMEKEEAILFPAIKKLEQNVGDHPLGKIILAPITAMEDEHQFAGDLVKRIRNLSNNYTPPEFACPTFKITYQKLREFDDDLMKHIHLENNILFERFKKPNRPSNTAL